MLKLTPLAEEFAAIEQSIQSLRYDVATIKLTHLLNKQGWTLK
jgi:hypothetical protein